MDGLNGQMSLFDFIEDPDREKKEKAKAWSAGRQLAEGYREGITNRRTCGNCKHIRTYCDAYTGARIGEICIIDRPFSTGTDPDQKACDRWSPEKTENETG